MIRSPGHLLAGFGPDPWSAPMHRLPGFVLVLIAVAAFTAAASAPVTLDDVVALVRAGVGDSVIVREVRGSGIDFHLGVSEILRLKEGGATDALIEALMSVEEGAPRESGILAAADPERSPSYRIFKEVGPDGAEILHVTNLDPSGRRMGPPPPPSEPASANPYDSRDREADERAPESGGSGERYVVVGWGPPPASEEIPSGGWSEYPIGAAPCSAADIYGSRYSCLYPHGRLAGYPYYPYSGYPAGWPSSHPGSCRRDRPHPAHYGAYAAGPGSHLGPTYFPVGPASGRASLAYLRSQVRLGGPPPSGRSHRSSGGHRPPSGNHGSGR